MIKGAFFILFTVAILFVVRWSVKNERLSEGAKTVGLLAMKDDDTIQEDADQASASTINEYPPKNRAVRSGTRRNRNL